MKPRYSKTPKSAAGVAELNLAPQRVSVDFPAWVVSSVDREAIRVGVTRQSLIKVWIAERLGKD